MLCSDLVLGSVVGVLVGWFCFAVRFGFVLQLVGLVLFVGFCFSGCLLLVLFYCIAATVFAVGLVVFGFACFLWVGFWCLGFDVMVVLRLRLRCSFAVVVWVCNCLWCLVALGSLSCCLGFVLCICLWLVVC